MFINLRPKQKFGLRVALPWSLILKNSWNVSINQWILSVPMIKVGQTIIISGGCLSTTGKDLDFNHIVNDYDNNTWR